MNKIFLSTWLSLTLCTLSYAQVSLVKDINPGTQDGVPFKLVSLGNTIVFVGNDSANNYEIWSSDGTESNTFQLHDINLGNQGSVPTDLFHRIENNKIYFNAFDGQDIGIYVTDGTANGLTNGTPAQEAEFLNPIELNGFLVFGAYYQNVSSRIEPYVLLDASDFNTPYRLDQISNLGIDGFGSPVVMNNSVYYSAESANIGGELCITTFGSGLPTNSRIDIRIGQYSSYPYRMTKFNNKIYFSANDGTHGRELWVTDGTSEGTYMILDMYPGNSNANGNPDNFIVYNNSLFFTAYDPNVGIELFKMDTSENISNVKDINPGSGLNSSPFGFIIYNGNLYFAADDGVNGVELWKSGGLTSNTNLLKDINGSGGESTPQGFVEYNGELYFNADDGLNGRELWKTDGTNAGTILVENINTLFLDSDPLNLTVIGDNLFFSAITSSTGRELFKYIDPSLSLDNVELENVIKLSPNPTSDLFSVETNSEITNLSIYDIQGKLVKTFVETLDTYNIEELKSGLYIIKITYNQGEKTQKLIKN
ncbi:ELWxxDGT repeat protein [Psychroserpens sp.]